MTVPKLEAMKAFCEEVERRGDVSAVAPIKDILKLIAAVKTAIRGFEILNHVPLARKLLVEVLEELK